MPDCYTCGGPFDWGYDNHTTRWVQLEPLASHDDLDRTFQDENGALRADHRERHESSSVNVQRLAKKVPTLQAQATEAQAQKQQEAARRRERRKAAAS